MSTTVLIGAQWGDEGKGKVSCYLAQNAAIVARYSGGSNAGHTVVIKDKTFKLNLIPAGIFYPDTLCVLGGGMVIDPARLLEEIKALQASGYACQNIRISPFAHLVLPYHQEIDAYMEAQRGAKAIGTTRRGIGPAYADKAERVGIRAGDMLDETLLSEKLEFNLAVKKSRFPGIFNGKLTSSTLLQSFQQYRKILGPMIADTSKLILETLHRGGRVLCEGAQGTMLDVDSGTYPYVTSCSTTAGAVASGLGIPPRCVDEIFGITKAYTTRVGEGSFPTQETGEAEKYFREQGNEYGTTTGRPRRCGWLDGLVLKYGHSVNGYTGLVVTKLDILSGLKEIKFCESYRFGKDSLTEFPLSFKVFSGVKPVYRTFPGWNEDITNCRKLSELPKAARAYLSYLEAYTQVPIRMVSVGMDRDQMILV